MDKDIHHIFIAGRHSDKEIRLLNHFPIHVYILIPSTTEDIDIENPKSKLRNIEWALLYDNLEDANKGSIL